MSQQTSTRINYWSRVAEQKRFSHPLRLQWLDCYSNRQARILDYGCGYGRILADLSEAGYKNLYGVDFSEAMLAFSRLKVPHANLVRNDGHHIPFTNDSFDVMLLFAVLTCIPDDDEQRILLAEAERVLRPGGLLYVSDLLINDDERSRKRYERDALKFQCYGVFELPEGLVVRHHKKEWIEELTSSLQPLTYEPFTVTTMNENTSAAFQYLGRKLI